MSNGSQPPTEEEKTNLDPNEDNEVEVEEKRNEKRDEKETRWGWFGYTPDYLQRFNTGFCWGLTIALTTIASNAVSTGIGKYIQYTTNTKNIL